MKWKPFSRVRLFETPWTVHSPWNSPGQKTGVGSFSLLQRIFLTQESNLGLLPCRRALYQLSYERNEPKRVKNREIIKRQEFDKEKGTDWWMAQEWRKQHVAEQPPLNEALTPPVCGLPCTPVYTLWSCALPPYDGIWCYWPLLLFKGFFDADIFKVFVASVTTLLLSFGFGSFSTRHVRSQFPLTLTGDWAYIPCTGRQSPVHRTTSGAPWGLCFFMQWGLQWFIFHFHLFYGFKLFNSCVSILCKDKLIFLWNENRPQDSNCDSFWDMCIKVIITFLCNFMYGFQLKLNFFSIKKYTAHAELSEAILQNCSCVPC